MHRPSLRRILPPFLGLMFAAASVFGEAPPNTPGRYKRLPCAKDPASTYDLFLPKAYAEKADTPLPVLYLSAPHANPGFMGLESWAETNGFILISINDSKNENPMEKNDAIQEDVLESTRTLRQHHCLRFAMGFSGAAWMSVRLAKRHPDLIAGVILLCHSGNGEYCPPRCFVGLLYGRKDTTHPPSAVEGAINYYSSRRYPMAFKELETGHQPAPLEERVIMLNRMYAYQRIMHPKLTDAEFKSALTELDRASDGLAAAGEHAKVVEQLAPVIALPKMAKDKAGTKMLATCGASFAAWLKGLPPKDAYRQLVNPDYADLLRKMTGKPKSDLDKIRADTQKDKGVLAEMAADKELKKLEEEMARSKSRGDSRRQEQIREKMSKLADKYPGTGAAEKVSAPPAKI